MIQRRPGRGGIVRHVESWLKIFCLIIVADVRTCPVRTALHVRRKSRCLIFTGEDCAVKTIDKALITSAQQTADSSPQNPVRQLDWSWTAETDTDTQLSSQHIMEQTEPAGVWWEDTIPTCGSAGGNRETFPSKIKSQRSEISVKWRHLRALNSHEWLTVPHTSLKKVTPRLI